MALKVAPHRFHRMLLYLQSYDFVLVYRPRTEILITNSMSSACIDTEDYHDQSSLFSEKLVTIEEATSSLYIIITCYSPDDVNGLFRYNQF